MHHHGQPLVFGQIGFDKSAPCRNVKRLRIGQVVAIESNQLSSKVCFKRVKKPLRCELFSTATVIGKPNVINKKFTVYVKQSGKVVLTKVYSVLPRKK